ncbi:uncharacterized protein BP01DRAFT_355504 [Aspergillus saccharolyticus JOP 1030-1]|uniref:Apple domain-containing protein n=1 Tax=Aspergillus saccharolyticus JOP 1030-1 TaxID=1450539 RepID=A0A318ZG16_9EURO|nr:hypothetical protein BP01DRAFT_355504 [Aspergillus saccharolyticus JOP 1030-1]PYH46491.1 hypothetical protein BP01DRAFT_355504 [Aspergillus saccharolyticus JOP 1030-1]
MQLAFFGASVALLVPTALAVATTTTTSTTTSTTAAASCTASLITTLCSYPEPGDDFAVAEDSTASCWDYCHANPPCSFVIFAAGNPTLDSGTCWLYPGETYNASAGSSDCTNPSLSVYSEPVCSSGSATSTATTPTASACAATATPTAIASGCDYPAPGDCFDGCVASTGATNCLSLCAEAEACSYVVFNPHNDDNSPYAAGTCWIYPNGTFDASSLSTCSGDAAQYVYDNVCPKASSSGSSSKASSYVAGIMNYTENLNITASTATGSNSSATTGSAAGSTGTTENSASGGFSLPASLAVGVALLMWQAIC